MYDKNTAYSTSSTPRFSSFTWAVPRCFISSALAALAERSMIRPLTYGPRSTTQTSTWRPFSRLVTRNTVPKGSVLWAATMRFWSYKIPEAVLRPWNPGPYQLAIPTSNGIGRVSVFTVKNDNRIISIFAIKNVLTVIR